MFSSAGILFVILVVVWMRAAVGSAGNERMLLDDNDAAARLADMEQQLSGLQSKMTRQEQQLAILQGIIDRRSASSGSVYVRWGRTTCPGNDTERVYEGYTAGSHYNYTGGGVNYLCLPHEPTWANNMAGYQTWRGNIYGTEFDSHTMYALFGKPVFNQNPACAVCRTSRTASVMIPARTNCYPGWTLEYTGYLMSGDQKNKLSTDYACVDKDPEFLEHGASNGNENVMYPVEVHCGTELACPPYVDGMELACSVCSK